VGLKKYREGAAVTRWFPNKKITVEECNKLEINFLKKQGFLDKGQLLRTGSIRWSIAGRT